MRIIAAKRIRKGRRSAILQNVSKSSFNQHDYGTGEATSSCSKYRPIGQARRTGTPGSLECRLVFAVLLLFGSTFTGATATDDAATTASLAEPVCQAGAVSQTAAAEADSNSNSTSTYDSSMDQQRRMVHPECRIVMAPSTLGNGTSGWGVFVLTDMKQGQPIMSGDVVIQVTDLVPDNIDPGMSLALFDYLWSSEETGGFYEGVHAVSVIPGIGSLSNGMAGAHNVLPTRPMVDEGGLTRLESPGAGSVTHYHNYTFFMQKSVTAGSEILLNYGSNWFQERHHRLHLEPEAEGFVASRSVDWLRQHGQCLDNLKSVARSEVPDAGRGVVATRNLEAGSIVAHVPVLPMKRDTLKITRKLERDGSIVQTHQLLLNYCLGHNKSSLLFYPYSPMIK